MDGSIRRGTSSTRDAVLEGLVLDSEFNVIGLKKGAKRYVTIAECLNGTCSRVRSGVIDRSQVKYLPPFGWKLTTVDGHSVLADDKVGECVAFEYATLRSATEAVKTAVSALQQQRQEAMVPRRRAAYAF